MDPWNKKIPEMLHLQGFFLIILTIIQFLWP